MNLKTSFFNTTLLISNIKRFWWIGAGYMVLFLSVVVLPLIDSSGENYHGLIVVNIISAISCALLPAMLFSYLNSQGAVTCMHAFPIKRRAHFITNLISMYILILVPMIIGYAFAIIYSGEILQILEIFVLGIILMTITISGAMLGVMITGNSIAAVVFGVLFIAFPFYTEAIFKAFLQENIYGIWKMNNLIMFENFSLDRLNSFMLIYWVVMIVLLFVSWFLYKYRKLESNGDIIVYSFLKPVFIGVVAVFTGFLGYFYLSSIYDYYNIFLMLPFGLIGIVVSYMLSKKAFTLKGMWKPAGIYVLAVLALFVVINFDLTGYEKRVPDLEDVVSVNISDRVRYNYSSDTHTYINGAQYFYTDIISPEKFEFTDKEDIQNVIKLHEHLTKRKTIREYNDYIPIVYKLKNGKTMKRYYEISYNHDKEFLAPVYLTEQMKADKWNVLGDFEKNIERVTITDDRIKGKGMFGVYGINDERAQKLVDAIYKDIENISYEHICANNSGSTRINIEYTRPLVDRDNKPVDNTKLAGYGNMGNSLFVICEEYTNTISLLQEYGLYDSIMKPEDFSYVELFFNHESASKVKITETTDIKAIYDSTNYIESFNNFNYSGVSQVFGDRIYNIEVKFYDKDGNYIFSCNIMDGTITPMPAIITYEAAKYSEKYSADGDIVIVETAEQITEDAAVAQIS